jgi:hypothetical protein
VYVCSQGFLPPRATPTPSRRRRRHGRATTQLLLDACDNLQETSNRGAKDDAGARDSAHLDLSPGVAAPLILVSAARRPLRVLAVACACVLIVPSSAPAASRLAADTPCWKTLLNEWYGGRIAHLYPIPCYQQAINRLPTDVQVYSSAIEDIKRAVALAIAHQRNPNAPAPTITDASPLAKTGSHGPPGPRGGSSGAAATTSIPGAIANSSPGTTTTFPLPLIILGGLAIFLLACGGVGLIVRRMHGRGGRA